MFTLLRNLSKFEIVRLLRFCDTVALAPPTLIKWPSQVSLSTCKFEFSRITYGGVKPRVVVCVWRDCHLRESQGMSQRAANELLYSVMIQIGDASFSHSCEFLGRYENEDVHYIQYSTLQYVHVCIFGGFKNSMI